MALLAVISTFLVPSHFLIVCLIAMFTFPLSLFRSRQPHNGCPRVRVNPGFGILTGLPILGVYFEKMAGRHAPPREKKGGAVPVSMKR
jgi:hypothetical protein